MKNEFVKINDKLLNLNKLLFITPTKNNNFYHAVFEGAQDVMWLTPEDFVELTDKLTTSKTKKERTS